MLRLGIDFITSIADREERTMSKIDIIEELPRLSHQERREIMRELLKFETDSEALHFSREAATAAFRHLDAHEADGLVFNH